MVGNPQNILVPIPDLNGNDIMLASLNIEDTGRALGPIVRVSPGGGASISITFANGPTNKDGVVSWLVYRPNRTSS